MTILIKCPTRKPVFCQTKNQPLIFDILGPFPDETFLSLLDKFLYTLRGPSEPKTPKTCRICPPSCPSQASIRSSGGMASHSCCSKVCIDIKPKCKLKCKKVICCENATSPKSGTAHVIFERPPACLCSSTCRKIKEMFMKLCSDKECKSHYTLMSPGGDGSYIYEVFPKYNIDPSAKNVKKVPRLIFVVYSNGEILPFETLKN